MTDNHTPKSPNLQIVNAAITRIEGKEWLTCKIKNIGNAKATSISVRRKERTEWTLSKVINPEDMEPGEEKDCPVETTDNVLGIDLLVGVEFGDIDGKKKPKVVGADLTPSFPDKLAGEVVNSAVENEGIGSDYWISPKIKMIKIEYKYEASNGAIYHASIPVFVFIIEARKNNPLKQ